MVPGVIFGLRMESSEGWEFDFSPSLLAAANSSYTTATASFV